jgi:hypothetical protein
MLDGGAENFRARSTTMAADYAKMSDDLRRFYDFSAKTVLFVGAAGKQLLHPSTATRKLIAIDKDVQALEGLRAEIAASGLGNCVEVIGGDFEEVTVRGDAVYFEFCLHEMADPLQALHHAKSLASDVVVYDHSAGSEWIYYGAEEDKVARSSEVMRQFGIRRQQAFQGEQRFATYDELYAKVAPQGSLAVERVKGFIGTTEIAIPFRYELNLL